MFVDEAQLAALDRQMAETGYLDGAKMASVFNMLRPTDLLWSYVVNNYVKGKQPAAFDLLYWNSDSTRVPACNHSFYLREFYLENKLAKGTMEFSGVPLDLGRVDQLQVQRFKKRKLVLRDRLSFLEDQMTPDIIA